MSTIFNPNEHKSEGFEALPAGIYTAFLESFERKTSKNSGSEYLKCTYRILGGKYNGKKVFDNLSFAPKALWRVSNMSFAVGQTEAFDLDSDDAISQSLCGKSLLIVLAQEEQTQGKGAGTMRNIVDDFKSFAGDLKERADELIEELIASGKYTPYQTADSGSASEFDDDDDDIPFGSKF